MTRIVERRRPLHRLIQIHLLRPWARDLPVQRIPNAKGIVREAVEVYGQPGLEIGRVEDVPTTTAVGEVIAVAGEGTYWDGEDVGGCGVGGGRGAGPGCARPICVLWRGMVD